MECAPGAGDAAGEFLRCLRTVAFVNPRFEQVERRHLSRARFDGDPAALAEAITIEARDKTHLNRIALNPEDDRDCRGCRFCRASCIAAHRRHNRAHLKMNQFRWARSMGKCAGGVPFRILSIKAAERK